MATVPLTVQEYGPEPSDFATNFEAAAVDGNTAQNADGLVILHVKNGGGVDTAVTIATPATLAGGEVDTELPTVNVPASGEYISAALARNVFNNSDALVTITCNPVASVTVQAWKPKRLSS